MRRRPLSARLYQTYSTGTRSLEGRVACKLAADNYGRDEWWLLLDSAEPS